MSEPTDRAALDQPTTPISPEAQQALDEAIRALDTSQGQSDPSTLAINLAQVGRCYRGLGDAASAEWYLLQSLRWTVAQGAHDAHMELLCELAEVTAARADELRGEACRQARDRARDHAFEAARLARRVADAQWETAVLLRMADVLDRCGDNADAVALQCRVLDLMTGQKGDTAPASLPSVFDAHDTVM